MTLYGREADRWRRKALGDGNSDAQRSRGGGVAGVAGGGHRWTDSIGARPGSEQADSEVRSSLLSKWPTCVAIYT